MKRAFTFALFLAGACSQETVAPPANMAVSENAVAAQAPLNPPAPGMPGGLPDDRTPIAEGPIDPKSAQGAGQVLQRYFAFVESGNSEEARKLWSEGAQKLDLSRYKEVHANIGAPGDPEGAAGSIYVDIPVQLYGRTNEGREFNARGSMTLRRVNDVPGSTPEQREWHIYSSEFPKG
jgi:hypothetical protein